MTKASGKTCGVYFLQKLVADQPMSSGGGTGHTFAFHILIALHETKLLDVAQANPFPPLEREPSSGRY